MKKFEEVAAREGTGGWGTLTARERPLYEHGDDIRNPFMRDHDRILHCNAYRRLKAKTQVFYNIENDHVCTRIEHVGHVESAAVAIGSDLGLNLDLIRATALGHDIGHAPFGHEGEKILSRIAEEHGLGRFWHERNGLYLADKVELLEDDGGTMRNLDLTYAVRDGIISHCGELDEESLRPRSDRIDLSRDFLSPGQYEPYTWEGCAVKLSDKIAYVGRDIEDALRLGFIEREDLAEVSDGERPLNTTTLMGDLICDVCRNSTPEAGLTLSPERFRLLRDVKDFNYRHIYGNPRFGPYTKYCRLVLEELFFHLAAQYDGSDTFSRLSRSKPAGVGAAFAEYLAPYCDPAVVPAAFAPEKPCGNEKIYGDLSSEAVYLRAVLDYLSGMTDRYAVKSFESLLCF